MQCSYLTLKEKELYMKSINSLTLNGVRLVYSLSIKPVFARVTVHLWWTTAEMVLLVVRIERGCATTAILEWMTTT